MEQATLSLVVLVCVAVAFVTERIPVALVAVMGAMACGLLGLIPLNQIFAGFSGGSAVLLMSMMIVGSSLFHTGLARRISQYLLRFTGTTERGIIFTTMIIGSAMSSICNNVGVVVTLMPIVLGMCRDANIKPSKVLYPLAAAAGLGGAITLVGTASSVTANSILESMNIPTFGFLEFAWVGIPLTILGIAYIMLVGHKLLPAYDVDWSTMEIDKEDNANPKKMWICGFILILVILFMAFNPTGLPLFVISSLGAVVIILTGCMTDKQAYRSIDWTTIFIAGGMVAVSTAVMKSGGGELIADGVVKVLGEKPNPYLITAVVLFVTSVMTQFLSNVSTASLMTPVAIFIAQGIGANPNTMAMVVAIAANSSFATPVGAQAFTVVKEPGNYRFNDFVKAGLPLVIINFILGLLVIPMVWPF